MEKRNEVKKENFSNFFLKNIFNQKTRTEIPKQYAGKYIDMPDSLIELRTGEIDEDSTSK